MKINELNHAYLNKVQALFLMVVSTVFGSAVAGDGWGPNTIDGVDVLQDTYYANSPSGFHSSWACYDKAGNIQTPGGDTGTVNTGSNDTCYTGAPLRKFQDPLPVAWAPGGPNGDSTGKYVPYGVPTKWINQSGVVTGDDYYEIAVVEYKERFHTDLANQTTVRGFVQIDHYATDNNAGLDTTHEQVIPGSKAYPLTDIYGQAIMISRPDKTSATGFKMVPAYAVDKPHYLGPILSASRNVPTRIKFTNLLPTGRTDRVAGKRNGDLFLPVDETLPGAGFGPDGKVKYTQNRAMLHLHGGDNPWISDGTPHQWIAPAGEAVDANGVVAEAKGKGLSDADAAQYLRGAGAVNVPDMADPGPGAMTYYYPNGESARLEWVHDHTLGMTRLNVYAGMVMPYLLEDPNDALMNDAKANGLVPSEIFPLVIQDKTFVPHDIGVQDARWDTTYWGGESDFWYPHVYETNQDPTSADYTKPVGRWDWGPYFWPVFPAYYDRLPTGENKPAVQSVAGVAVTTGLTEVTVTPEAFVDTPLVNGQAYPTVTVDPKPYRFRILNGMNDRYVNLGFYIAADKKTTDPFNPTNPSAQPALCDGVNNVPVADCTEVKMVNFDNSYPGLYYPNKDAYGNILAPKPGNPNADFAFPDGNNPATAGLNGSGWGPVDGHMAITAGVPDPVTAGPDINVIANEGGYLANLVSIPSTPINYENNKRSITILNVMERGLFLSPAQRADVVVDFSQYAGKTLILYNDAPAPLPAGDPRLDYYTGMGDYSAVGGNENVLPGYGPNDRTIMQVHVNAGTPTPLDVDGLAALVPQLYGANQPKPVVPEPRFAAAFPNDPVISTAPETYAKIFTGAIYLGKYNGLQFTTPEAMTYTAAPNCADQTACLNALQRQKTKATAVAGATVNAYLESKTIQELFEPTYGRMNATLGVELPFTSSLTQTTIPLGYVDPVTEKVADGETQFWKVTHNGVDSHPVHFHLVNVQVINRVGWDGTLKPPMDDEIGWKETVVMHPLEDVIVAVRSKAPNLPFGLPNSVRLRDPSQPLTRTITTSTTRRGVTTTTTSVVNVTTGFTQVDPTTGQPATVENKVDDYGWEYVWHCHILGHEENDFMRAVKFDYWTGKDTKVGGVPVNSPDAVTNLAVDASTGLVTWDDPTPFVGSVPGTNPVTSVVSTFTHPKNEIGFKIVRVGSDGSRLTVNVPANQTSFQDDVKTKLTTELANTDYTYSIYAYNQLATSALDTTSSVTHVAAVLPPANLVGSNVTDTSVTLTWTDNATNETSYEWSSDDGLTWNTIPAHVGTGTMSYVVTGLTANTQYSFMVGARNSDGLSATATATVLTTLPLAVTNLAAANIATTTADLTWTLPVGGGTAVVTVSPAGPVATVNAGNTGATLTGLVANTTYTVTVNLLNGQGLSGATVTSSFKSLPTPIPGVTSVTTGAVTATSVVVSWANPNAAGTTTAAVNVYNSANVLVRTVNAATSGTAVTGLASNTVYHFGVVLSSTSSVAKSAEVMSGNATTTAGTVTAIRFTAATATTATVGWTNPATGGNATVLSVSPAATIASATANSASLTGLKANTTYTVSVSVKGTNNVAGATVTGTGTTLPVALAGLTASATTDVGTTVTWTNANTGTTTVNLQVLSGTTVVQTLTKVASGVKVVGLTPNTTYTLSLVAVGTGGSSTPVTTNITTNAGVVTGLGVITETDTSANFGWVLPTTGGTATATVTFGGVSKPVALTSATNANVTGLVANNNPFTMSVSVKGTNGIAGTAVTATGYSNAAAPTGLTAVAAPAGVTLTWTDPNSPKATSATVTVLNAANAVVATYPGVASGYVVTGLAGYTPYSFKVTLTGSSKQPSQAAVANATTTIVVPASVAVTSVAASGTATATVSWADNNATAAADTATVVVKSGTTIVKTVSVAAGAHSVDVTGLVPNTSYTFGVTLTANGATTTPAVTVSAQMAKSAVTNIVTGAVTGSTAAFTWTNPNVPAVTPTVRVLDSNGAAVTATTTVTATGVTVSGLALNTTYTVEVSIGSLTATSAAVTTIGYDFSTASVITAAAKEATTSRLTVTDNAVGETGYDVQYFIGASAPSPTAVWTTPVVTIDGGIVNGKGTYTMHVAAPNRATGTKYWFRVRPTSGAQVGTWSGNYSLTW